MNERSAARNIVLAMALGILLTGCCGGFWGGAAGGAAGTGAGYELRARQQLRELKDDYKAGRITREEYDSRRDQIEKGSIVY